MKTTKQWMLAAILTICGLTSVNAQTLRGTVKDILTGDPIVGAVVVAQGDKTYKAVANADGAFEIKGLDVGRYTVESNSVGYEPERMVEVLVGKAKETVLTFQLRELAEQLQEVTVRPVVNKARAQNPVAVAGVQMISVDEASRFGGTLDDIARVVGRYVGTTGSVSNNGFSTHGNPASMSMYRLEGVEVPSPVHFDGSLCSGFGDISALHTNLLSNSDYYTSAAPAEMGNTMGGVMDLRLRPGNNAKYEHSVKLATLGLEATSEGPLSRKNGSSYIVSYRYGLTKLLNDIGVGVMDGDQADYHDLLFKLNFPLDNSSTLSLWGLGAWDKTYMLWDGYDEEWKSLYEQSDYLGRTNTVTGGLTYDIGLNGGWRLRADVVAAHRESSMAYRYAIYATDGTLLTEQNRKTLEFGPATPYDDFDSHVTWLTASVAAQKRFSSHYLLKFGSSLRHIDYDQDYRRAATFYTGQLLPLVSADKKMEQVDAYATNNLRYGQWTLNAGLHLSGWTLSNDWTLQPRLSAEWKPAESHTLALGYAMTTRNDNYDTYFATAASRDMKLMRSHQLVFNYCWQPTLGFSLKAEAWAELQDHVPVSPTTTWTSLNRYLYSRYEVMTDAGRGRNYGVSVGAEQYMTDGLYWLLNGSLYKAEYRDINHAWHPTLFDRGWNVNAAIGKEWKVKGRHLLSVNLTGTAMGGLRYTPFDDAASASLYAAGKPEVAYDYSQTMTKHHDPIFDLSMNINYRIHGRKFDQIIGFDYMNLLSYDEPLYDYYNYVTQRAWTYKYCYSLPNISYAIEF